MQKGKMGLLIRNARCKQAQQYKVKVHINVVFGMHVTNDTMKAQDGISSVSLKDTKSARLVIQLSQM